MSDSLRPLESSSIDAELRIRLEGQIELLEDALPLFDSVLLALGRKAWTEDDRVTVRECVLQLPRIEEAVERATQHAQATRLTRALGEKRREIEIVAKARLGEVGAMAPPSLRGMLSAILELNRRQAVAPESGEQRLMRGPGPSAFSVLGLCAVALAPWAVSQAAWWLVLPVPALVWGLRWPRWALLADRLHLPAGRGQAARDVMPSELVGVELMGRSGLRLVVAGETIEVPCAEPERLESYLRLLGGTWLRGLEAREQPHVVLEAEAVESRERGLALLTGAGVMFVPKDRGELAVRALVDGKLRVVPELREVLALVARLPEQRLRDLAVRLGERADAVWLGRGEVVVERSANANLGVVVRSAPHPGPLPAGAGRGSFRVMIYGQAVVAEALLSRLQAT